MPFLNPKLGIDFSDYIGDRTRDFTGRTWVFESIRDWWADSNRERFFLLTGEPGSGKTAIAARLAQFAQGVEPFPELKVGSKLSAGFLQAVHFCSARDSVWTDPTEFARSLALQLASSIPEFGLALKDVGEKTNNINVDLTVGTAQNSHIQGVVIQNLTLSGLTGQEAFTKVVVNPLRQIQQEGFSQLVTILVDSLDEALTHDGKSTIVGLLSKLSADVKLRLVLTSRNEGRVKDKLREYHEYEELFLSAPEHLEQNQQDIREYIEAKFRQEETLRSSLQVEALDQNFLITTLIKKSEGNFLYVRFLLESVALGQQSFASLDRLPQGLDKLYYSSLGRVVELGKKGWSEVYAPVMGVLLAAQESLTESQIRAFTKLEKSAVWDCLNDLQQFLDEIESEGEETLYKLYHQSVTDFLGKKELRIRKSKKTEKLDKVKNRYYLSTQEQHQRIIEYYCPEDKPWNEIQLEKIDAYGRLHLALHLVKGDRVEELHTLLSLEKDGKNAWFKAKDSVGDTAGFLADVNLAWDLADQNWTESTLPQVIQNQCRYALITSSLISLSDIDSQLLVALVKAGLPHGWTPAQGLAYARQIPDADKRCISLELLAPYLPDDQQEMIWQEALNAALAISNESVRAQNLEALAAHLPQSTYETALKAAQAIDYVHDRMEILIALAARFPSACELTLNAILGMESFFNNKRTEFLGKLAAHFSPACEPALEAAKDIQNQDVLIKLAAHYQPAREPALKAAKAIQEAYDSANALIELAAHFPPAYKPALKAAKAIYNEQPRTRILIELAALYPAAYKPALKAAQVIQDESDHAYALSQLAVHFPSVYEAALKAAQAIQDESNRAYALNRLAIHFPPACEPALIAAQAIQNEVDRAYALNRLAIHFPPACKPALMALMALLAMQDDHYNLRSRIEALTDLASHYPAACEPTLTCIHAIQNEADRVVALTHLAAIYPPACEPALKSAQVIKDESSLAWVLRDLVVQFPNACEPLLNAAQVIQNESNRAWVLRNLAAHCSEPFYETILNAALAIQSPSDRALILIALATNYPDAYKPALEAAQKSSDHPWVLIALAEHYLPACKPALEAARAIQDDFMRANALSDLAAHYPAAYEPALKAAQAIQNEVDRANVLRNLAINCPAAYEPALEAAKAIPNEDDRANVLSKLPEFFPQTLYEPLLDAAQTFKIKSCCAKFLCHLAIYFPIAFEHALKATEEIQDPKYRADVLNILTSDFPSVREFALKTSQEIKDEFTRIIALSNLAAYLDQPIFKSVLAAIQNSGDDSGYNLRKYRDVLIKLAAYFPDACEPALAAALDDFPWESIRAEALRDLVVNLPQPIYEPALVAALEFKFKTNRCMVLSKIIPRASNLPIPKQFAIWQMILRSSARRKRPEFLSELQLLLPMIAKIGSEDTGVAVVEVLQQVTKWWE